MADIAASLTILASTGTSGDGLVRTLAELPPHGRHVGAAGAGGELWFVIEGSGQLDLDGSPELALMPDRGVRIPAGAAYQVEAHGPGDLRIDIVAMPGPASAPTDGDARLTTEETDALLSRDVTDCDVETTGDRKFRVLFGPGRDCAVATQFVGEIPPGRAPEHSHPYDEVVLVLRGSGIAHVDGTERELSVGTCVHLPPGVGHCLENTGTGPMRVLGVFHPADSPAAKLQR
jgi:mannose-6-phosphate isomerase-like protein (cupin superfamily)